MFISDSGYFVFAMNEHSTFGHGEHIRKAKYTQINFLLQQKNMYLDIDIFSLLSESSRRKCEQLSIPVCERDTLRERASEYIHARRSMCECV